jgi:hypothetical protein
MMMEKLVESLAGETEVLGENLPQCRFVHHKHHMLPGRDPEPPRILPPYSALESKPSKSPQAASGKTAPRPTR